MLAVSPWFELRFLCSFFANAEAYGGHSRDDVAIRRRHDDDTVVVRRADLPIAIDGNQRTGLRDDLTETPADYRAPLLLGKTLGLPMLCANPDIVVDMGDKRLYCAGALAQEYEQMGGTTLYFGKPHPPIYDLARRRLAEAGAPADPQILCIGDGISTDIQGGIGEGLDTLFISGGLEADRFGTDAENPDQHLLDDWLDSKELSPTYAMGRLR